VRAAGSGVRYKETHTKAEQKAGDRFTRHFSLDTEQFIEFTLKLLFELLDGDRQ